ncbi:hypothetical protein AJ79_06337 [Helicocarpus griseus UAMH5409]|uniref:FAR-17a/AIG1-like protein n=1 Tax=Helicocarpus griseus UAMH5409 TaxID=1447875 RepID=A0A2B7XER1_9EURO|nr:hypothetical protein AJ79_06337 [Helicocarpus griseus UAMH5409]
MRSIISLMGVNPADDKLHRFETSWLFSPFVLAILRGLISLYCFVTFIVMFAWQGTHGDNLSSRRSFSYFTNLTFWGVAFYFLVASIHTFLYARTGRSVLFDKWPRWLRALHSLFYSTVTCFPFVVLIVYWALLYTGPWYPVQFDAWTNISQHAMPPFFSLFEIIFSTAPPPPPLHIAFLILILALYVGLAYITYATQGFYVYSFLDPGEGGKDRGLVAAYAFGVLAGLIVIFGVVWLLSWLRVRLVSSKRIKFATKGGDVEVWDARRGGLDEDIEINLAERK